MKHAAWMVCATLLALLSAHGPAQAGEPDSAGKPSRSNGLYANVGIGSVVGLGGLTYRRSLSDHFLVEGGTGLGVSGFQLSAMGKWTIGSESNRWGAGIGTSLGAGSSDGAEMVGDAIALWANLDLLEYEHRFGNGLGLLLAAGMTSQIGGQFCAPYEMSSRPDYSCRPEDFHEYRWRPLPQARLAVGYRF